MTSQPTWLLVVGWLAAGASVAVLARWWLRRALAPEQFADATGVASPLMPALGAVFALLAALSLAGEASATREAGTDVSLEAAAASRLAWASTSDGFDTAGIQSALVTYLAATRANEWTDGDPRGDEATLDALADLEAVVRSSAAAGEVGSAQAGELLTSVDAVTSLRRQRLATASQTLPGFYVAVVVISGMALVANSSALALGGRRRIALLTSGLVIVVGLAIALLFALSDPFHGGFVVDDAPFTEVIIDLDAGRFQV